MRSSSRLRKGNASIAIKARTRDAPKLGRCAESASPGEAYIMTMEKSWGAVALLYFLSTLYFNVSGTNDSLWAAWFGLIGGVFTVVGTF